MMEVYVDDMLVKSVMIETTSLTLAKCFPYLRNTKWGFFLVNKYKMRLNLNKCAFGVSLIRDVYMFI